MEPQPKKKKRSGLEKAAKHAIGDVKNSGNNTAHMADKLVARREACRDCKVVRVLNAERRCPACAKLHAQNKAFITIPCAYRHCPDLDPTSNASIKAFCRHFCTSECMRHYEKATTKANLMREKGCSEEAINEMLNQKPVYCTEYASDQFGIPQLPAPRPKKVKQKQQQKQLQLHNDTTTQSCNTSPGSMTTTTATTTTSEGK